MLWSNLFLGTRKSICQLSRDNLNVESCFTRTLVGPSQDQFLVLAICVKIPIGGTQTAKNSRWFPMSRHLRPRGSRYPKLWSNAVFGGLKSQFRTKKKVEVNCIYEQLVSLGVSKSPSLCLARKAFLEAQGFGSEILLTTPSPPPRTYNVPHHPVRHH